MQHSSKAQYSREQIMCGLRRLVPDIMASEAPFDAATRIDTYNGRTFDDLDFADVAHRIERAFGFRCPLADWQRFCGSGIDTTEEWEAKVGPRFTFGHLADFIAERAQAVPLESLSVLGKDCDVAGAFQTLAMVARELSPGLPTFGPSTPICRVFIGGKLFTYWDRLRWMTEDAIPPLRATILSWLRDGFALVGVFGSALMLVGTLVGVFGFDWHLVWLSLGLAVCVGALAYTVCRLLAHFDNPLPQGVHTFRDLAIMVAKSPAFMREKRAEGLK